MHLKFFIIISAAFASTRAFLVTPNYLRGEPTVNTLQNVKENAMNFNKTDKLPALSNLNTKSSQYSIDDKNPSLVDAERRQKVKEMMQHAWSNYRRYAWGENELRPVTKGAHIQSVFGPSKIGATIVDSLDTLYIMGMTQEFNEARDWVVNNFTLDNVSGTFSVFETNIRFIGGFLAAFALTGDAVFKEKAQHVAEKLLPAFQTPTGIPKSFVDFKTGASGLYFWSGGSILSDIGTFHLEFSYLSDVTGNQIYRELVMNIRSLLKYLEKPRGLYPINVDPMTGEFKGEHFTLGGCGDSFFEYLLKAWLQSGKTDTEARQMYDEAMVAITEHLVQKSSSSGLTYVSAMNFNSLTHQMDHLTCFAGGLFGLGARTLTNQWSEKYMELAEGITNTCHESYIRAETRLGPDMFRFYGNIEATSRESTSKIYLLRPETFESYFVMWRLTHNQKYRDWGWDAIQALETYCRVEGGYSGIKNVYDTTAEKDDTQQSFFLAESLKYLYLLYSDDSLLSLDEWVFNTEAHPLPVKNVNSLYRAHSPLN